MKVLVTGGGGQLSTSLSRLHGQPLESGNRVEVVSLGVNELDITVPDDVTRAFGIHRPDVVVNAAAYTAVDKAESEEDVAMRINVDGPRNLASACRVNGVRFVQISTDFVFPGTGHFPITIDAEVGAISVYGRSKEKGEDATREILGQDALIVRTAWVYAAGHSNFVASMLRLMGTRDEVGVVADQIGTPTWVTTLASGLLELIDLEAAGTHHLTDAGVASWYDFAVAIGEIGRERGLLKNECRIHPIRTIDYPTPAQRPAYCVLDKTSTFKVLGRPSPHWRESLTSCLSNWSDPT